MDEGVYVNHIHHPRRMWWQDVKSSLRLDVAWNFTYVTYKILVVHVGSNLFLVANYNCKLKLFF
jgi:hypothetical protein